MRALGISCPKIVLATFAINGIRRTHDKTRNAWKYLGSFFVVFVVAAIIASISKSNAIKRLKRVNRVCDLIENHFESTVASEFSFESAFLSNGQSIHIMIEFFFLFSWFWMWICCLWESSNLYDSRWNWKQSRNTHGSTFLETQKRQTRIVGEGMPKRQDRPQPKSVRYFMFLQNIFENISTKDTTSMCPFGLATSPGYRSAATAKKLNPNDNNKFQFNFAIIQFEAEDTDCGSSHDDDDDDEDGDDVVISLTTADNRKSQQYRQLPKVASKRAHARTVACNTPKLASPAEQVNFSPRHFQFAI